ncbi:MAG: carboxylate-amine ligase [Cellvibrionaceae bacterium]|jgi:carboxylate-amine ligase
MTLSTPPLTLGIEEEFQIVNPETRDLHSSINLLIEADTESDNKLNLKPEFMQSQVEVGSDVCQNISELRQEVVRLRRQVIRMAEERGLAIVAAATHPFAKWSDQSITDADRYREMLDDMQGVARSLLIFGMHVHVGFGHKDDLSLKNLMIEVMNQVRYFVPHILALSTSSPFWQGESTGLKSYRSVMFEQLPRTGIPPTFESWGEYHNYEKLMTRVGAFGKGEKVAKIWWDIRPHPIYDTLEFRITDICTTVDEAVCIAALFQAVCAKLIKLRRENMSWRNYRAMHISENKWRAVRYGIHGQMIDFGKQEEVPFHALASELLGFVDDVLDDLGSRKEVEFVSTILKNGTSADRQLRVFQENGGEEDAERALKAVVDHLILETKQGL